MKTQNKNLEFNSKALVELNTNELKEVNGGSTIPCIIEAIKELLN